MPPRKSAAKNRKQPEKGKKAAKAKAEVADASAADAEPIQASPEAESAVISTEPKSPQPTTQEDAQQDEATPAEPEEKDEEPSVSNSVNMADRMAKMQALRARMNDSAKANRKDLIAETNTRRESAQNLARLERKRKQAELMGEKQQARETGEDLERKKAWEYSIEDNEKWDKKLARQGRRADFSFTDYDDIARRKYKKDIDILKPDLAAYNQQREAASAALDLITASSSNPDAGALVAAQGLYRDANSFVYADHKPSEASIDRVIGKLNLDLDKRKKRSRERKEDEDADITYINEKNKQFNKKLERHFNEYTKEIKDSFERGTALG